MLALAQRTFGAAYQFVPPMSITLGMRECLSAARVRLVIDASVALECTWDDRPEMLRGPK